VVSSNVASPTSVTFDTCAYIQITTPHQQPNQPIIPGNWTASIPYTINRPLSFLCFEVVAPGGNFVGGNGGGSGAYAKGVIAIDNSSNRSNQIVTDMSDGNITLTSAYASVTIGRGQDASAPTTTLAQVLISQGYAGVGGIVKSYGLVSFSSQVSGLSGGLGTLQIPNATFAGNGVAGNGGASVVPASSLLGNMSGVGYPGGTTSPSFSYPLSGQIFLWS